MKYVALYRADANVRGGHAFHHYEADDESQ